MPHIRHRVLLVVAASSAAALAAACGGGSTKPLAAGTNSPSPTASATPTPSPTAPAVYPLTGLPVTNAATANRPALSVKIDNVDGALPQAGLNKADIVTDILVEGGLTRLMATFQSQDASLIGPIRSARPVDADLLRELGGGIFAYSGADPREIAPSKAHSTALLIANDYLPMWFWRSSLHSAPHNVFSSTAKLYKAGRTYKPHMPAAPQLFTYSSAVPASRAVGAVSLRFSPDTSSAWTWSHGSYLRTQNGRPDVLLDGGRISATNIVIMSVTWHPTSIIDDAGNADPYVIVIGSGPAWVMRDGHLIVGHWVRPSYRVPVKLVDAAGNVIPLRPGRTWIELQPRPYSPVFS